MTDAYVFEAREEKDVFTSDGKEYVTPMYSYNPKGNKVIENTDPKLLRRVTARKNGKVLVAIVSLGRGIFKTASIPHDCIVEQS